MSPDFNFDAITLIMLVILRGNYC